MAKSTEELLGENNALLKQLLAKGGPSGNTSGFSGGSSGSTSGIPNFNPLTTSSNALVTAFDSLYRGTMNTNTALNAMTGVIDKIPLVGGALGTALQKTGQAFLDTNTNIKESSKVGANYNNNLSQYAELVGGARLTQEQYNNIVKENSMALNGLGSTVNRSQTSFLQITKGLNESGVVSKLKEMGLSAEEVAAVSQATLSNRVGLDLSSSAAQKQAIESAIGLTVAMEETTRITGMSREAQTNELKARSENAMVQAELAGLDAQGKDRYDKLQTSLMGMGKGVQDFADEVFTGGIRTKEGSAKLAALGTAGTMLEQAVLLQKNAKTAEEKQIAEAAMTRAKAAVNERMASEDYRNMVRYNTDSSGEAARSMLTQNKEYSTTMSKQREELAKGGAPISAADAAKKQKDEVDKSMVGRDESGKKITAPGTELAQTINKADRALSDQTAGVTKQFGSLVESANNATKSINGLNDALKSRTQGEAATGQSDLVSKLLTGKTSSETTPKTSRTAEDIAKPVSRESGSPGIKDFLSGAGFDKMFENFGSGTPAILHGEETVIRKDQFEQFKNEMNSGLSSVLQPQSESSGIGINTITDELKSMMDSMPIPEIPDLNTDFKDITDQFKSIATNVELPDFKTMFNDVGEEFSSIFDTVEIPDMNTMFTGIGDQFSDITKNLEIPDMNTMFTGIGDQFSSFTKEIGDTTPIKKINETFKSVLPKNKDDAERERIDRQLVERQLAQFREPATNKIVNTSSKLKDQTPEKQKQPVQQELQKPVSQQPPVFSTPGANNITLKEINDQLILLNKAMGTLISSTNEAVNLSSKQVKATKSLSGNRLT